MKAYSIVKKIFIIAFALICMLQIKTFAFYTEDVIKEVEYTNEYKQWLSLSEDEKQAVLMPRMYNVSVYDNTKYYTRNSMLRTSLISSKLMISNYDDYDLRDDIRITVRNQENTGMCWAISTNSVIESNIEKTTGQVSPLFSARYVEYATARTFLDGINSKSYNREVSYGGFPEIVLGLYTSGNGPVLEEDLPFENNQDTINLESIQNKTVQKQIKDYVRFDGIYKTYTNGVVTYQDAAGYEYTDEEVKVIRNEIKEHILKYGAVASQTYGVGGATGAARVYYNNTVQVTKSTAYFCNNPNAMADHQVTIIGWDDDYAITNFNENYRPSTPGAYIVLNSWGEEFGEDGVYYISYEDAFIERGILGVVSTTDIGYDNIYQYDELGNNYVVAGAKEIYGANVFERTISKDREILTEVSISSLVDTKCDIYVNAVDGELKEEKLKKVASNVEIANGYHTIELENPIELSGDKFVVAIKYLLDEKGYSYIGLEYPDSTVWNTATAKAEQSYLSTDLNNWDDLIELSSTTIIPEESNLCIKAFTKYEEQTKFFEINNYSFDSKYIYGVLPETKISEFTNNIFTNMEYYIYNTKGEEASEENLVSTGMKVKNEDGDYKIVVNGDLNGDGKISITDVVKLNLHTVNINSLNDEFFKAADVNKDNQVTITDLVVLNLVSVNMKKI